MRPNKAPETTGSQETVFPLPLTPFEYYYYLDDSPEYPTAFPIELRFSGMLSADHFQAALEATLARHPMLTAVIDSSGRRPAWIAEQRARPAVDWADESVPMSHPTGDYIDLAAGAGLRVRVRTSPGRSRVVFHFHHACCDGLAGLRFIQEVLTAYKIAAGDASARQGRRELDSTLLRRRGELATDDGDKGSLKTAWRDLYVTLRVWSAILFRASAVLQAPAGVAASAETSQREILPYETEVLSRSESARLHALAESLDVTTNDLLLRDLLLALADWNRRHGGDARRPLRINVPMSVRGQHDARMPAANRIGFGFVTAELVDDPRQLLETVSGQTRRMKQWKLGLYFLGGLSMASRVPAVLRWALRRNQSLATAVLSNVGRFVADPLLARPEDLWTCGDVVLKHVTGMPPIRKLTRAAVLVIEYGGEIALSLRCDPRFFDVEQTRALLGDFTGRVRQTLERGA
ncbi:MAG: hypothetical protein WDZ48_06705 [Pirellulales bacterium]